MSRVVQEQCGSTKIIQLLCIATKGSKNIGVFGKAKIEIVRENVLFPPTLFATSQISRLKAIHSRLLCLIPPHLKSGGENAWLVKKYGRLDENWPQMLRDGFAECMRVLSPDGVLIFKWSEVQIPAGEVWKAIGQKPLFGHHSGKKMNTFWACFMKL